MPVVLTKIKHSEKRMTYLHLTYNFIIYFCLKEEKNGKPIRAAPSCTKVKKRRYSLYL